MLEAIILCAGQSSRMGFDKLNLTLNGGALWLSAVLAFSERTDFDRIILVGKKIGDFEPYIDFDNDRFKFVVGGETRFESVKNALRVSEGDVVVIHDGARPFVSQELIDKTVKGAERAFACAPVLPLSDSLKRLENGKIVDAIDRNKACFVQTPQAFNGDRIRRAYAEAKGNFTDDTSVYSALYGEVETTTGDEKNIKFTTPLDAAGLNKRTGIGGDVHKLKDGLELRLGGVLVPYHRGLEAHSDGDVIIHAIMDGLLSAAGEPDIGVLFPDNDDAYKGISSLLLLDEVRLRINDLGYDADFVSVIVFAQKPKLSPYVPEMREILGKALNLEKNRINLSVTTTEGLGLVGEEKGIACLAFCTLKAEIC